MLYAVVTYANMCGVRAVDRIVELCKKRPCFYMADQRTETKKGEKGTENILEKEALPKIKVRGFQDNH